MPGEILGQLGNRIQHALRAFTPRDQKAVRTAAETFPANPRLDVAQVISQLGVGETLVSTLQEHGVPMPVERAMMAPPRCRMGTITADERATIMARSSVGAKYNTAVNRESAYEILTRRHEEAAAPAPAPQQAPPKAAQQSGDIWFGQTVWQGQPAFRLSVSSWRTTDEHIDRAITLLRRIRDEVENSL